MSDQKLTTGHVGRTVLYTLSYDDAETINSRRLDAARHQTGHGVRNDGSVVHTGNRVARGDEFPMVITRVWVQAQSVNGQVLLDGSDTFWATSRSEGEGEFHWRWPEQV